MKNGHNNRYVCINLLLYFKGHAERYDSLDLVYAPKKVIVTFRGRFDLVYDPKMVKVTFSVGLT